MNGKKKKNFPNRTRGGAAPPPPPPPPCKEVLPKVMNHCLFVRNALIKFIHIVCLLSGGKIKWMGILQKENQ